MAVLAPRGPGERRLDLGLAQLRQAGAGGAVGGHDGQALLDVAAVPCEMPRRQRLDGGAVFVVQVAACLQMVGQAPGLVAGPCLEGGHELALVDQAVLEREQSEEEMAVGGGSHGTAPNSGGRSGAGPSLGAGPGITSHRADYCNSAMPLHPCRGVSSDSVSVDPRARDWIPTRRGVRMSVGSCLTFQREGQAAQRRVSSAALLQPVRAPSSRISSWQLA